MSGLDVEVDSAGAPSRFFFAGRRVEVAEVLDHWPGSDHAYFKVHDGKGATYILRHATETDRWEVTLYVTDDLPADLNPLLGSGPAEA